MTVGAGPGSRRGTQFLEAVRDVFGVRSPESASRERR